MLTFLEANIEFTSHPPDSAHNRVPSFPYTTTSALQFDFHKLSYALFPSHTTLLQHAFLGDCFCSTVLSFGNSDSRRFGQQARRPYPTYLYL